MNIAPILDAKLIAKAFEQTRDGIMITDKDGVISYVNHALSDITGYNSDELVGSNPRLFKSGKHNEDFYHSIWEIIKKTGRWEGKIINRHKDGHLFSEWLSINEITDTDGATQHYIGIITDITNLENARGEIEFLAYHDPLTGLPNRASFPIQFNKLIQDNPQSNLAIIFIDVDNFKFINDHLGHDCGDQVLKVITARMQKIIRKNDFLVRFGGDEFAMLVPYTHKSQMMNVVHRLKDIVSDPVHVNKRVVKATLSIGITIYPDDGKNIHLLIANADMAMYRAKDMGKNTYCFFNKEIREQSEIELYTYTALQNALANNELHLVYQPLVDTACNNTILGIEALLRWKHPTRGELVPVNFLPIAEKYHLIFNIDQWVLNSALQALSKLRKHNDQLFISINISPQHFLRFSFVKELNQLINHYNVPAASILLEITEDVLTNNFVRAYDNIEELKRIGVRLSLDGFGSGYSSIKHLTRIKLDQIKIDKFFTATVNKEYQTKVIIESICNIGKKLDIPIIAVGVAREAEKTALQELGCQLMQGYSFYKPLLFDDLIALIAKQK